MNDQSNKPIKRWLTLPFAIANALWLLIAISILATKFHPSDGVPLTNKIQNTKTVEQKSLPAHSILEKSFGKKETINYSLADWNEALTSSDQLKRLNLFSKLIQENRHQLPEIIQALDKNRQDNFNRFLLQCGFIIWSRIDGENAFSYALKKNTRKSKTMSETELTLDEWLEVSNPTTVANFLQQLSQEDIQKINSKKLLTLLKNTDIDLAISLTNLWALSPNSEHSIKILTKELIQQGSLDTLISWVDTVSMNTPIAYDEENDDSDENSYKLSYKYDLIKHVIKEIAQKDLSLAQAWVEKEAHNQTVSERTLQFVTKKIAEENPAKAANWLLQLPDSRARNNAFKIAIDKWSTEDPDKVATWINQQHNPQFPTDNVVSAYTDTIMNKEPARAMEWGESIKDENIRKRTLLKIGYNWKVTDESGFEEWLQTEGVLPGLEKDFSNLLNHYTTYPEINK